MVKHVTLSLRHAAAPHLLQHRPQLPLHSRHQLQAVAGSQGGGICRKGEEASAAGVEAGGGGKGQQRMLSQQVTGTAVQRQAGREERA